MRVLLFSVSFLLLAAPTALAAQDPSARDVLIRAAPDPYELSPEREGVTGPIDAEMAQQLGMSAVVFEQFEGALDDTYVRVWIHPNGEDGIVAAAMKGVDDPTTAGLLNGSILRAEAQGWTSFDVGIPDARGFIDDSGASESPSNVAHVVLFRRGLYMFTITIVGPGATSNLARDLAQKQFERAPEGATTSEFRPEPSTEAEAAYQRGASIARLLVFVAVVAGIVFAVRRHKSRSAPTSATAGAALPQQQGPSAPTPSSASPGRDSHPGEGSGGDTSSDT